MTWRHHSLRRVAAAFLVAIGLAVVWGVFVGWAIALIETRLRSRDNVYESVMVRIDGTPLIETRSSMRYEDVTYRSLDGNPVAAEHASWIYPASLFPPIRPPGLIDLPLGWGQVMSIGDYGRPLVDWYLLRDNQTLGHAYFVGYEKYSAALVGYIGRNGFRRAIPPLEEWFDLGRAPLGYGAGVAASSGYLEYDHPPQDYGANSDEMRLSPWLVFLIDGSKLLEIDLRNHTIRSVYEAANLISVNTLQEFDPEKSKERVSPQSRVDTVYRIAIRTNDRIIVLDPPTGAKREFVLPELLTHERSSAFSLGPELLLIEWSTSRDTEDHTTHLLWLKPDGSSEREESITLANSRGINEKQAAWGAALLAPVPIGWVAVLFGMAPLELIQENRAASYAEALHKILPMAWQPMLLAIAIGAFVCYLTWHLQRKYRRCESGLWCGFVLLLGVPAFVAYWLEQRRPKLEPCSQCGQTVPRDRDACADCHAPFPAPPPVGTEILA